LFLYSPMLASISAGSIILVSVLRLLTVEWEMNLRNAAVVAAAKQQSVFMENIRSISVTKSYNLREVRLPDWENSFSRSINTGYHVGLFQLKLGSIQNICYAMENILVIYFGALLIQSGELSLGQLLGFIFLKQHFATSVMAMFPKLAEMRLMRLELDRVADIVLSENEYDLDAPALYAPPVTGDITIRNLEFSYGHGRQGLFKGLNCVVEAGQLLVVCGPSGSGKSTLVRILSSLEQGYLGEVRINSRLLGDYDIEQYRENISVVHHGDRLIVGDLAYNIHLDTEPFNFERLQTACVCAEILDVIQGLPQGFSSSVGEMGDFLSAGQVQRVLIARAVYRRPRILFLDESLSHLSDDLALRVIDNIRSSRITLVLVTHNPALLRVADQVLTL
ncbi:MAG: ATP-binding cassette domain-containing protein, partial [Gammaproteobacteria bacterium]